MNKHEALKIIDRALQSLQADRQTHQVLMQAVQVLSEALSPKGEKLVGNEKSKQGK